MLFLLTEAMPSLKQAEDSGLPNEGPQCKSIMATVYEAAIAAASLPSRLLCRGLSVDAFFPFAVLYMASRAFHLPEKHSTTEPP